MNLHSARHIRRIIFLLAFCCLEVNSLWATHIVGGELNYTYMGNNLYRIRLTVYRDCFNGIPPFDNPAALGIFDSFNNLVTAIPMNFPGSDTLPPTINSPCFIPPTNICYEHTTYESFITLQPRLQGYQLVYQRCCRNYTILNIVSPDQTGATYYATIPTTAFANNSNPVFKNWPPPFICLGIPFTFDHSATDSDGDSIAYDICNPFTGADTINSIPQPPNPPPYSQVVWQTPYNLSNLLGGTPLTINPVTGILTCTPNHIGQFVVGICAHEFRNGVFLSTTRRDFQLNVVACPTYVVAALQNPIINCRTNEVTFQNQSINAGSYQWDFGVTGSLSDTSIAVSPVFIYPDTGVYQVTLIAHSLVDPACTDTARGTVTILPEYSADFTSTLDTCTNTFSFFDTSNTISGTTITWNWNFGDGSTSNTHNPVHYFDHAGTFTVTLIAVSTRGCIDTVTQVITVPELLRITNRVGDNVRCWNECNGSAAVTVSDGFPPYQYLWNDPASQSTSLASNLCPGTYTVTVTDDKGCIIHDSFTITQPDSFQLKLSSTVAYCHGNCIGTTSAQTIGGNGGNSYQWNDPSSQQTATATALCTGNYRVTVRDSRGCMVSDTVSVIYSDSLPVVDASADTIYLFQGQSTTLHAVPTAGYSLSWTPSSTLDNSASANPVATPPVTTIYTISVTDVNNCPNSDTITIFVDDVICKEPELFIPNAFSPNADTKNDVLLVRGNTIESMHIAIYDRWGEKVFESSDQKTGWDGTYKGANVVPAVYVYYLDAVCYNKLEFRKKGNITVIR